MINEEKDFYSRIYSTMITHDLEYNDYASDNTETPFLKENFNIIQHNIIAILSTLKETTMSNLAKRLSMLPPNLSPIVKNLEKRGFIIRNHKDSDKRFVYISLSDKGAQLVAEQNKTLTERLERILNASLTAEEQKDFLNIYEKLVVYFGKMNDARKNLLG